MPMRNLLLYVRAAWGMVAAPPVDYCLLHVARIGSPCWCPACRAPESYAGRVLLHLALHLLKPPHALLDGGCVEKIVASESPRSAGTMKSALTASAWRKSRFGMRGSPILPLILSSALARCSGAPVISAEPRSAANSR